MCPLSAITDDKSGIAIDAQEARNGLVENYNLMLAVNEMQREQLSECYHLLKILALGKDTIIGYRPLAAATAEQARRLLERHGQIAPRPQT